MSATTVNTFPPLHALNSPRSWFLALIVLLHARIFWALTRCVTINVLMLPQQAMITKIQPAVPKPPAQQREIDVQTNIDRVFVPRIETPNLPPVYLPNAPRNP